MSDGMPLNDEDRKPWIARVTDWINSHCLAGRDGVISCSALKKSYRQTITSKQNDVYLVYLRGTRELLSRRLTQRRDHFMPPDLLDSQLDLLEEPSADERAIVVTIDRTPNDIVKSICDLLGLQ